MHRSRSAGPWLLLTIALGCSGGASAPVSDPSAAPQDVAASASATGAITGSEVAANEEDAEANVDPWRIELLDLAFEAASRLPLDPHVKNRSKLQAEVIAVCTQLGLLERAERYAADVVNWRRGVALGELAHQAARRGDVAEADRLSDAARAELVASIAAEEQEWRSQSILAKMALTELTLGRNDAVLRLEREIEHTERLELVRAKAHLLPEEDLDLQLDEYASLIESKEFAIMNNVLAGAVELHERFYDSEPTRARVESLVDQGTRTMPARVRLDVACQLTEQALQHGDRAHAIELLATAQRAFDEAQWLPEDRVPALARLGSLRFRVGSQSQGLGQLGAALGVFQDGRPRIPDVFRGDALRPVAEAYLAVGEREAALSVFHQLVEEGALNPNSRPRAQDLVRTALELARLDLRPDDALRARLSELQSGLGEPW